MILGTILQIKARWAPFLSNESKLGAICARIFMELAQNLRDFSKVFITFAQISIDFSRIFTKSKHLVRYAKKQLVGI